MSMIKASKKSHRTTNPIRNIVDNLVPPQNHPKSFLNLALGDPTLHGNLGCPTELKDGIREALKTDRANGYVQSIGTLPARQAIADYSCTPGYTVAPDDVIIASGCSGAIDLVLTGMLDEGENILVPCPGFPLYQVITESLGCSVKRYNLTPETGWECDLEMMDSLVDENTKAIVINNPSNPCGSNFSLEHLKGIAAVARKHKLPIIADEIYAKCVFNGTFTHMHEVAGDVPVISVGGLAKEFVVPGWRVGWLVFHDQGCGTLKDLRVGIRSLTQIVLGANALIQAAIPSVLKPTPGSKEEENLKTFSKNYMKVLRSNAEMCLRICADCKEISAIEPQGAMYMMIHVHTEHLVDEFADDTVFSRKLLEEENVFVLPGQCFGIKNFVRLVICAPAETVTDAINRIRAFCVRHKKAPAPSFASPRLKRGISRPESTKKLDVEITVDVAKEVEKIEEQVSKKSRQK